MDRLATLLFSGNETLKWLSLLPTLIRKSFRWWQCSVSYSPPPTPPPHTHTHPTTWDLGPCRYLSEDTLALTKSNERTNDRHPQTLKATLSQQTHSETLTYDIPTETKRQALHGDTGAYSLGLGVIITLNHNCMSQFFFFFLWIQTPQYGLLKIIPELEGLKWRKYNNANCNVSHLD